MQRGQRFVLAFIACLLAVAAVGALSLFLPWTRQAAPPPQPAAPAAAAPSIVGRWESVAETTINDPEGEKFRVRDDDVVTYGRRRQSVQALRYWFNADGSGQSGYFVEGMGAVESVFTWTLQGDTLTMHHRPDPGRYNVGGKPYDEAHRIRVEADRMTWLPNGPTFQRRPIPIASQGR